MYIFTSTVQMLKLFFFNLTLYYMYNLFVGYTTFIYFINYLNFVILIRIMLKKNRKSFNISDWKTSIYGKPIIFYLLKVHKAFSEKLHAIVNYFKKIQNIPEISINSFNISLFVSFSKISSNEVSSEYLILISWKKKFHDILWCIFF